METTIKKAFKEDFFFITALGTAFDFTEFESIEDIKEIYILNDHQCTFVKSMVQAKVRFETYTEGLLLKMCENNFEF